MTNVFQPLEGLSLLMFRMMSWKFWIFSRKYLVQGEAACKASSTGSSLTQCDKGCQHTTFVEPIQAGKRGQMLDKHDQKQVMCISL